YGLDQGDGPHRLGVAQLVMAGAERVDLQGSVAAGYDPARGLGVCLGGALGRVPAVGVRRDPVGDRTAEQLPHGTSECFALDIPARCFDTGDTGHHDLARTAVVAVLHPADQVFGGERVGAQNV